jgi:ubiquinone/menaquinone biosynthesis C-methylase UbiE
LDACCGYGVGAVTLAREYDHLHVTGVDMYTDKELTEQIIESPLPGNVSLISTDVCNMSIESSTIDICYSMAGVAYIPDALLFFKELHRVLRPGGRSFLYLIRGSKDISTNITLDQLISNVSGFKFSVHNMNTPGTSNKGSQPYYKDGIVLEMLKTETDFNTDYIVKRYVNTMSVVSRPMEKFYISAVYG